MAYSYSHQYNLQTTGLRFFTVLGAGQIWLLCFAQAINNEQSVDVFNDGNMQRDFTYIDDVVEGVIKLTTEPF